MVELVYAPVITAVKGVSVLLDIDLEVRGGDHVPRSGGAVMASNHVS